MHTLSHLNPQISYSLYYPKNKLPPKTFSSAWEGSPPEKIQFIEDPYGPSKKKFAIEKGKELYHTVTNCMICHKSYVSKEDNEPKPWDEYFNSLK